MNLTRFAALQRPVGLLLSVALFTTSLSASGEPTSRDKLISAGDDLVFVYEEDASEGEAPSAVSHLGGNFKTPTAENDSVSDEDVSIASEILSEQVGSNPDAFGGHFFDSTEFGFVVWVVDINSSAHANLLQQLSSAGVKDLVQFRPAAHSLTALKGGVMDFAPSNGSRVLSLGVDTEFNTLALELDSPSENRPEAENLSRSLLTAEEMQQLDSIGVERVVVVTGSSYEMTDSRNADSGTKSGGAGMRTNAGSTAACSHSIPANISGWGIVGLTAGHCVSNANTWYSPGKVGQSTYSFGARRTNSYPSNAYRYGDFAVLGPFSTAYSIWTSNTGKTSLRGVAIYPRAKGEQLCMAGGNGGAKCRYHIQATYVKTMYGSTAVYPTTRSLFKPNGSPSCAGFVGGDSGGAVYYAGSGGLIGNGIISGGSTSCPSNKQKHYFSSELHGICSWAKVSGKSVSFPHVGGSRVCPS